MRYRDENRPSPTTGTKLQNWIVQGVMWGGLAKPSNGAFV